MKFRIASLAAAALLASGAAQAQTFSFAAGLAPEVTGATGGGAVFVDFNLTALTLELDAIWFGLSGTTTVSHLHCCVATPGTGTSGVAVTPGTLPGFPVGLPAGTYSTTLNLALASTYTGSFLAAAGGTPALAATALFNGMTAGRTYFNVHSSTFGGGEVRGFLAPVPEPATYGLMALGLVAVGAAVARRHQAQA
jgi:hypothetical protein